jgi:formylglycine-generating enzyme required for sulfatase activity
MEKWSKMISLRSEMKTLRTILALACSFTTSHAVAQAKAAPRAGTVFRDCRACPEMVVLPAGSFSMGSSAEEKSWAASHGSSLGSVADEAPQHQVSLPSFALGKYDVTRGEYAAFARETGYPAGDGCGRGRAIFKWEKDPKSTLENPGQAQTDRDPVVCVSWQDARAYIAWLNRKAHRGGAASANGPYRLPSEAEWEYAARAGTTTKFYWGDDDAAAPVHAWFNANSGCKKVEGLFCDHGKTHPVGAKPPNAFGLYDMAGNVWQWTEDCYDNSYAGIPADGRANEALRATQRRRTAKAIASEWIAAARGCFRRGCCDRPPENATLPTTAMTSWVSAPLERSREASAVTQMKKLHISQPMKEIDEKLTMRCFRIELTVVVKHVIGPWNRT